MRVELQTDIAELRQQIKTTLREEIKRELLGGMREMNSVEI
jgi:hypothetical protein